jgi:phospholipid/cholesterol/gamma-HCH transport system ATP-binding protein
VSHELKQTLEIADPVIVLANGRVAAEGAVDNVRNSADPMVVQYLNALPDGPVRFHFPGLPVAEDFRLAQQPT